MREKRHGPKGRVITAIVAAVMAAVLAVMVASCAAGRPQYSFSVVLCLDRPVPADYRQSLAQAMSACGSAQGGADITVTIDDVSANLNGDSDIPGELQTDLAGALASGNQIIVITDSTTYQFFAANQILLEAFSLANAQEGYAWDWKGSKLQSGVKSGFFPNEMYFSVQPEPAADTEVNENRPAQYAQMPQRGQEIWQENYDFLAAIINAK